MTIGTALRQARKRAGLSQVELARALEIPRSFLQRIEADEARFPRERLDLLPPAMRKAVIRAMRAELREQDAALRALL